MKNKVWFLLAGIVALLVLIRLGLGQLSSTDEINIATDANDISASPHNDDTVLSSGTWAQQPIVKTSADPKGVVNNSEWREQVEAFGHDPDSVAKQEALNQKASQEFTQPQTPEQWFPAIATLLNDKTLTTEEAYQRQQDLARFVQSVDSSIEEIEASLKSMKKMTLSEAKQQAYTAMGREKVDALRQLKEQALGQDPSLMSVELESVQ